MTLTPLDSIGAHILILRGQKVLLDSTLAVLYGVATKVLLQAVKRHADRFPPDFMFRLSKDEFEILRSQLVTSNTGHGGRRYASASERFLDRTDIRRVRQLEVANCDITLGGRRKQPSPLWLLRLLITSPLLLAGEGAPQARVRAISGQTRCLSSHLPTRWHEVHGPRRFELKIKRFLE